MDAGRSKALGYRFQVNALKLVDEIGGRIVEMPIATPGAGGRAVKNSRGIFTELSLVTRWGVAKPPASCSIRKVTPGGAGCAARQKRRRARRRTSNSVRRIAAEALLAAFSR